MRCKSGSMPGHLTRGKQKLVQKELPVEFAGILKLSKRTVGEGISYFSFLRENSEKTQNPGSPRELLWHTDQQIAR